MKTLLIISSLLIVAVVIIAAGCTSPQGGGVPPVSPTATGTLAVPSACGFTSCHGLSLACGTNPPQVCTALYQIGDKCRQYASCSDAGGGCHLITTPQFDSCRSCVERCGGGDPAEILGCEEKCGAGGNVNPVSTL